MVYSLNRICLIGNVGREPEIRTMQSGKQVASFSVATSESWKDRESGEFKSKTEWHGIVVFREGLIPFCERALKKGTKVYVEGTMVYRKWKDQTGNERLTPEVVLQGFDSKLIALSDKASISSEGHSSDPMTTGSKSQSASANNGEMEEFGDEIPF